MIEVLKNKDGFVTAYIEYLFQDRDGKEDPYGGWLYIRDLWIHKSLSKKPIIRDFIREIYGKCINVHTVYWLRHKYKDRMKKFHISRFEKHLTRGM